MTTGSRAPTGATNVYLLGTEDALLIDPGGRDETLDGLLEAYDVGHVAVTHHHPDHLDGLAEVVERTDATVWARAGRTQSFEGLAGIAVDRTVREGTVIETGDGPIPVLETPGHAPEHVSFVHPEGLICGDLAVANGSVVVGAPDGDMRAYLTSLRRIHARAPAALFPGHGPPAANPRETCTRLIRHRLRREGTIRSAVEGGAETVPEIRERAYEKDLTGVIDLANATVRAHLEKLAVEGTICWDGDRAHPIG
jgi:glyoxylase-like metal-dependent hydrolase (beta-lactamase superfamily II)